jgi:hypothetical protein
VGTKAIRSIKTTIITEIVGSLVNIQGINPNRAKAIKYLSSLGGFLNPYFKENKNIIKVKTQQFKTSIKQQMTPDTIANIKPVKPTHPLPGCL